MQEMDRLTQHHSETQESPRAATAPPRGGWTGPLGSPGTRTRRSTNVASASGSQNQTSINLKAASFNSPFSGGQVRNILRDTDTHRVAEAKVDDITSRPTHIQSNDTAIPLSSESSFAGSFVIVASKFRKFIVFEFWTEHIPMRRPEWDKAFIMPPSVVKVSQHDSFLKGNR